MTLNSFLIVLPLFLSLLKLVCYGKWCTAVLIGLWNLCYQFLNKKSSLPCKLNINYNYLTTSIQQVNSITRMGILSFQFGVIVWKKCYRSVVFNHVPEVHQCDQLHFLVWLHTDQQSRVWSRLPATRLFRSGSKNYHRLIKMFTELPHLLSLLSISHSTYCKTESTGIIIFSIIDWYSIQLFTTKFKSSPFSPIH